MDRFKYPACATCSCEDGCKAYVSASPTPMLPVLSPTDKTFGDIRAELERAAKWPGFNSAHEGYAVLLEEVDELWEHVKTNQKRRDIDAMRAEAVQVAAMAIKFIEMLDAGRCRA